MQGDEDMQQAQAQPSHVNPFATTKNKYLDNFASSLPAGANQALNTPSYTIGAKAKIAKQGAGPGKSLPTVPPKGLRTELDRLQNERRELVETGCYTDADPLIQEMVGQMTALKIRQGNL